MVYEEQNKMVRVHIVNSWMAQGQNLEEAVCEGIVVVDKGKEVVLAPQHKYLRAKNARDDNVCRTHYEVLQRYVRQGIKIVYHNKKPEKD
jgi:hypothetical protein